MLYDYSSALSFEDKILPDKITISEAGQPVIEARIESVSAPAHPDSPLFTPAGLTAAGTGNLMSRPWTMQTIIGAADANSAMQVVVLHGLLSPNGHVTDLEVIASSNPRLNQIALDRFAQWRQWRSEDDGQPGATPQSHELFLTLHFLGTPR